MNRNKLFSWLVLGENGEEESREGEVGERREEEEDGGIGSSVLKRRTKQRVLKCCLEFLMM